MPFVALRHGAAICLATPLRVIRIDCENDMDPHHQAWLEDWLRQHGGVAGTVHRVTHAGDLALTAAVNIPSPVIAIVQRVPRGKGMAGLAYEQNEPISTCNIQTDDSGRVRP